MATALHPPRDSGVHVNVFPRAIMTDLDFKDNRYPSLPSQTRNNQRSSSMVPRSSDQSTWETQPTTSEGVVIQGRNPDPGSVPIAAAMTSGWAGDRHDPQYPRDGSDLQSLKSTQSQSQEPQRSVVSYALPPGARRVVERYSLDENVQRIPSRASEEGAKLIPIDSTQDLTLRSRGGAVVERQIPSPKPSPAFQDRPLSAMTPPTPRHPALPATGVVAGPSNSNVSPSHLPVSPSPIYNPPISPKPRAPAQQPTYITPTTTPNPMNTVYTPAPQPPQEEVCVECAMRDQDMADVDVSSPGVWERESDVLFDELVRRERQDALNGVVPPPDSTRPRSQGGRLTERNLKIWLSLNPREPSSRQQTLNAYLKSQRTLLKAEALAHARAMQEAKQLDNRMRDAYSQLRRSAYDMGSSAAPADDTGGVRIKPPRTPTSPSNNTPVHTRLHSREITLLENGMIVEHVDVRKEEREARERRRKDERRARKSSRSSIIDMTSIISAQSYAPQTESGLGLKPFSRYSQHTSGRPTSALTAPVERVVPSGFSQASFSDVHSLASGSPGRPRFFGFKNMSSGGRSRDSLAPSGMSGSMIDMHVALHREQHGQQVVQPPIDLNTPQRSQIWPPADVATPKALDTPPRDKPKKKTGSLTKIWRIVTGSSKSETPSKRMLSASQKNVDDLPLAPPPPLSFLVDRPSELVVGRHTSTPSLPSIASPKPGPPSTGMSPPTAPSSLLPSPTSSRPSGLDLDMAVEVRKSGNSDDQEQQHDDNMGKSQIVSSKNVHPVNSEPDMRKRVSQSPPIPVPPLPTLSSPRSPPSRPASIMSSREKSLPPLPGESQTRPVAYATEPRPRTVFTYDSRQLPPGGLLPTKDFLPPQPPFRTTDTRRQSFGGMASLPNIVQTIPNKTLTGYETRRSLGPRYDEFGTSRGSLARLGQVEEHRPIRNTTPATPTSKRKSRFGLSSLLGLKSSTPSKNVVREQHQTAHQFPTFRNSVSDGQHEGTTNGYATSSRHSGMSTSGPRMSVTSRKALEELVAQDPEFVAYRYPSNDQSLDLLR